MVNHRGASGRRAVGSGGIFAPSTTLDRLVEQVMEGIGGGAIAEGVLIGQGVGRPELIKGLATSDPQPQLRSGTACCPGYW